ncbi:hypothetical protein M422DRAFT_57653 [Sphaerobolus stellatus SS14]|nr:hypothetical protein M422DRAFT_57653 [Sphaerobolus stellatus SS14]
MRQLLAIAGESSGPSYPFYYPYFDANEKFPPTELFGQRNTDPDSRADKAKASLLKNTTTTSLNPYSGTVPLSKEGLDELALYTVERKVLLFRDQDFKDLVPEKQIEITRHFGPIQRHPTSGNVKGFPEFHTTTVSVNTLGENRLSHTSWHSDVVIGGDTPFLNQAETYNRLSPEFKKRLEGLKVVHSAVAQAEYSRGRGGPIRREPVETEHPVVRVHPVTGEKALFVNQGFTRRIWLLDFWFDHIAKGADFHARATYRPGTVVVWDNRVTAHSATSDFSEDIRRHAVRLTSQAEVPIPATA